MLIGPINLLGRWLRVTSWCAGETLGSLVPGQTKPHLLKQPPPPGVYEQFELLSPGGDGEAGPLAAPWRRVRVRLRSRLVPHVALDIEVGTLGMDLSHDRFCCWAKRT